MTNNHYCSRIDHDQLWSIGSWIIKIITVGYSLLLSFSPSFLSELQNPAEKNRTYSSWLTHFCPSTIHKIPGPPDPPPLGNAAQPAEGKSMLGLRWWESCWLAEVMSTNFHSFRWIHHCWIEKSPLGKANKPTKLEISTSFCWIHHNPSFCWIPSPSKLSKTSHCWIHRHRRLRNHHCGVPRFGLLASSHYYPSGRIVCWLAASWWLIWFRQI